LAWTTPKTMGSEIGTSSDWNTYVRDNELYLYGVALGTLFSSVQLTRTAATSINDSTYTAITWTAEVFDFGGWWSSGTNIVVPSGAIPAGYTTIAVAMVARTKFATSGTGNRAVQVLKNGSSFGRVSASGISGDTTDLMIFEIVTVAAADVLTTEVWQTSGGALNVSQTQVSVYRIAPAT